MKNLFFTTLTLLLYSTMIFSKLQNARWEAIATDIAREGEPEERGKFEAAKQALFTIESFTPAQDDA